MRTCFLSFKGSRSGPGGGAAGASSDPAGGGVGIYRMDLRAGHASASSASVHALGQKGRWPRSVEGPARGRRARGQPAPRRGGPLGLHPCIARSIPPTIVGTGGARRKPCPTRSEDPRHPARPHCTGTARTPQLPCRQPRVAIPERGCNRPPAEEPASSG